MLSTSISISLYTIPSKGLNISASEAAVIKIVLRVFNLFVNIIYLIGLIYLYTP